MTKIESFIIQDSARKKLMDQKNIFGSNFVEMLAEIITNSDDSYSRIEEKTKDYSPKQIDIYFDRKKDEFTVVDFAEGIGKENLTEIFKKYADDTSNTSVGNNVRGMFGRGATDVLIESSLAGKENYLISFKGEESTKLIFKFDNNNDKSFSREELSEKDAKDYRNKYKIEENGTIVRFGTGRKYPNDIISAIEEYYMLRFIFSNKNRIINLYNLNEKTCHQLKYDMSYFDDCEVLCDEKFDIKYKGETLEAKLKLVLNSNKKKDHFILVYDEKKAVYDDSGFNRETESGMNKIEGRLEIINLTNFAKKMMNENGETIVTPTRDGFEKRNEFYINLKNKIDKFIINACAMVSQIPEENKTGLKDKKEWKNFFKDINKYFKEELDSIFEEGNGEENVNLPENGIKFIKESLNIKNGKHYLVKLLVNPDMIEAGSIIQIINGEDYIELTQDKFIFKPNSNELIPFILVDIIGKKNTSSQKNITAICGSYEANLYYDVSDEEIHYPAYGFDFFPSEMRKKPVVTRTASMYVDINKFPIGSTIKIEKSSNDISIDKYSIAILEDNLLNDNIAKIDINISGGNLGNVYKIFSTLGNRKIELPIIVQENEDESKNKNGIINDIIPRESSINYIQTYYDNNRNIIVVSNNIINKELIPKWLEKKEYGTVSEKYAFYNILAEELARIMIREKKRKDLISISADPEEFFNMISEEKDKIYKKLLKSLEE